MHFSPDPSSEFYTPERCHIIEILNTPNHPHLSLARARVEPGVTTQVHVLSMEETYYILSGSGILEISGLPLPELRPGDAALIPAGASQRITNTGASDLLFLCICHPRFTPETYTSVETGDL